MRIRKMLAAAAVVARPPLPAPGAWAGRPGATVRRSAPERGWAA
jgi:hypothetical protein